MRDNLKSNFIIILNGFIIGSSMGVPGISGGTMAIILGIYDKLINSISHFLCDIRGNIIFLLKFIIGAGVGISSLAFVIQWLLEKFPFHVSFFFLGAVFGGIPALYKKTKKSVIKISSLVYCLSGFIIVISIGLIPTGNINIVSGSGLAHYLMLLLTGIIISLALLLPGISTSHMLLILGMYDTTLSAITKFDIVYVGILGISTMIGILLIIKPIEWALNRFTYQTYYTIIGFVLGSTVEIFRYKILTAIPVDADTTWWISSIVFSIVIFVIGFRGISSLARFSND